MLPGALIRNRSLRFVCRQVHVRVETTQTPVTSDLTPGEVLDIPVKHGEGQYVAGAEDLARARGRRPGRVPLLRAGRRRSTTRTTRTAARTRSPASATRAGNVVGLMPHPEHAVDPDVGPTGGQPLFASLLTQALARV